MFVVWLSQSRAASRCARQRYATSSFHLLYAFTVTASLLIADTEAGKAIPFAFHISYGVILRHATTRRQRRCLPPCLAFATGFSRSSPLHGASDLRFIR